MKTISYKPSPGECIDRTVTLVTAESRRRHCRVRFKFNKVTLEATPKKSPVTLVWEFHRILDQHREAYRMSRRGREEQAGRELEIAERQDAVTACIRSLPGIMEGRNLDHIIGWLDSFTYHADDIGVDMNKAADLREGGHEWVALLFEAKGFTENAHVGNEPAWFNTRQRMGEYIIGQAINCLRLGLPPHPITHEFVQEYFALPSAKPQPATT